MVTYLKDEVTGVTVESPEPPSAFDVRIDRREHDAEYYSDPEARAVVEGLLRRMLEREGWKETDNFVWKVMNGHWREAGPGEAGGDGGGSANEG